MTTVELMDNLADYYGLLSLITVHSSHPASAVLRYMPAILRHA